MTIQKGILLITFVMTGLSCKKEAPAPPPEANFFAGNNGCSAPCEVVFFDDSQNAVKWRWNFGNGSVSTLEDDTALYEISGTYEVWLRIWNADNVVDSVRKNITIN